MKLDYGEAASYRRRAAQLRTNAQQFRDQALKTEMLQLAERWEVIAGQIEAGYAEAGP
jgi:hypothetical protein